MKANIRRWIDEDIAALDKQVKKAKQQTAAVRKKAQAKKSQGGKKQA